MLRRLDRDIPFILLTDNYDAARTTAVLKAGGQGAVPYTERALLMLVVDRELTDLNERRRRLLESHLCKAEQRCQRLLESSKDAIAYVIEGMRVYVNAAEHPILNDKKTINHVHRALDDDRFRLIFQPVINLCGENEEHYEVYVRMLNDKSEEVSPYDFLPPPGLTDTVVRVDRWIFLQAIKKLAAHRVKGQNTRLFLNVTAETLRQLHCKVSISQFGCSLNPSHALNHIDTDYVRIDGSFTEELRNDHDARTHLKEIVQSLQSAGKLSIVPLVDSAGILATLWQAGVNYIQGDYLQPPTPEMTYDFSDN